MMEDLRLYTTEEVTDILKVTQRTLYNYIKAEQLKASKVGKYWRIKHVDLLDFINGGTNVTQHAHEARDRSLMCREVTQEIS